MNPHLNLIFKLLISSLIVIVPILFWSHKFMEVITLSAILVALFREKILAFYLPPALRISIAEPPDYFAEVPATNTKGKTVVISWFSPETTIKSLSPNTPIRFSVGYSPDYNPEIFDFEFVQKPNELSQISCPPNQTTTFKFEAKAISDNSRPSSAIIEIEFKGTYKAGLNVKLSKN